MKILRSHYLPYCMIGLCAATAWASYPESPWHVVVNVLLIALWSHSAWLDAECRRLERTIKTLKKWRDEE
jgi:hypothetical protein